MFQNISTHGCGLRNEAHCERSQHNNTMVMPYVQVNNFNLRMILTVVH